MFIHRVIPLPPTHNPRRHVFWLLNSFKYFYHFKSIQSCINRSKKMSLTPNIDPNCPNISLSVISPNSEFLHMKYDDDGAGALTKIIHKGASCQANANHSPRPFGIFISVEGQWGLLSLTERIQRPPLLIKPSCLNGYSFRGRIKTTGRQNLGGLKRGSQKCCP